MAPDFKTYLATQIVAEKQTVSYRNVARALKVHVNAAKCMLYEFHQHENKKSKGSIYATYLVCGTKGEESVTTNGKSQEQEDDAQAVPSSPPPFTSSMLDPSQHTQNGDATETKVSVKTITLVREEALESVRKQYETISSIHIYSLSPGRLPDLVALTDIGRDIFVNNFSKGDPLKENKIYGVIQNPAVRRREGKRPKIVDTPPVAKFQAVKDEKKPAAAAASKDDSRPGSKDSSPAPQATKPSLKKDNSSLFKAFAKQQDKPKLNRQDTDQSTNASASGAEDVKMTDADEEGDSEDEALFLDTNTRKSGNKKRPSEVKKDREDKAAKLRKMMDSDDEEPDEKEEDLKKTEESVAPDEEEKEEGKGGEVGDAKEDKKADEVDWSESDTEAKKAEPTEPRRRRGKRKVMKKRTMKDEDGYLVTKEEAVWESFSEDDEPEPAKEKPKPAAAAASSSSSFNNSTKSQGQKSSAPAKGDGKKKGNIMSFFGKK